jgi:dienelactone hydrolase
MVFLKNILIIFVWFVISYFIFLLQPLQDFTSYILSLTSENYKIKIKPVERTNHSKLYQLFFTLDSDTSLSAYLKIPLDSTDYPSIIILGGMLTGKDAVNYAYGVNNVILAAPDYRYKPRSHYNFFTIIKDLLEGYNATYLQVVDNLLLIKFLKNWKYSKNKNLSILGYSFGVPFAAATARICNNIDYLALVYGGADLHYLIKHNISLFNPFIDNVLANLFWLHVINFEPSQNLQFVKPMPTLVINGGNDEKIPNFSAQKLQDAINYNKTVIWIDSKHVHPANEKLTHKIIDNLNSWYKTNNFFQ